ncbi:DUF4304 domain-containing protein [Nocardioides solisilvae]|uniref:DUF4304 domain-containing protein n=1 Tax=Nocardioides solisilvae TaxID=1542435 RepID=UPI000D74C67D|nr:DUF4304 domain-containing protein [Nocardioides solisilvae]
MRDLDAARDVVDQALAASGHGWDAWPEVAATAGWTSRDRLAALLLLLSVPEHVVHRPDVGDDVNQVLGTAADGVIDRLRRGALPWDAATVRLGLAAVSRRTFDDRGAGVVLAAAQEVGAAGGADAAMVDALRRFDAWLHAVPHRHGLHAARRAAARALSATTPPDLLDLSLVQPGDGWGPLAREAARVAPVEAVGPLVRALGGLGHRSPSQRWLREVGAALAVAEARGLLRAWLEEAAVTEPGRATDRDDGETQRLLAPGNEDVVRAAVLATRTLPDEEEWVPRVLGFLARRGAAPSGPGATTALALKVAGAAVDTLVVRGGAGEVAVLTELFQDLTRRDLVRKVGAALAARREAEVTPAAVGCRDDELRRSKAAQVRRRADPAPARARAAVDALLRSHLLPTLRAAGFEGGGRTWRRPHDDRVDLVHLGSSRDALSLVYGVRFDAAHPSDRPRGVDRSRILAHHLDVSLDERWTAAPDDLDRCADHLRRRVLPFLDTFAVHALAQDHLLTGAGTPPGARQRGAPGGPARRAVVGLLALEARDRTSAVEHLAAQVARAEGGPDERAFWQRRLDEAEALPGA